MLRHVEIGVQRAVQLFGVLLGDDVDHAAGGAVTVTGCRGAAQHFDTFNHFRRDPGGIAAGITLTAPALTHRVAAAGRFAVNQDQGIFRAHAADIDLAVVAALAAGGVTGQVNAGHGADQLADITGRWALFDFVGGNGRNPRCLQVLLGGSDNNSVLGGFFFTFGNLVCFWAGVSLLCGVCKSGRA